MRLVEHGGFEERGRKVHRRLLTRGRGDGSLTDPAPPSDLLVLVGATLVQFLAVDLARMFHSAASNRLIWCGPSGTMDRGDGAWTGWIFGLGQVGGGRYAWYLGAVMQLASSCRSQRTT
jgi:hypothetical protein